MSPSLPASSSLSNKHAKRIEIYLRDGLLPSFLPSSPLSLAAAQPALQSQTAFWEEGRERRGHAAADDADTKAAAAARCPTKRVYNMYPAAAANGDGDEDAEMGRMRR